jgi:hypothetical protein
VHQRVRLLAATLPSLLLGVWVTLLVLLGGSPASGPTTAGPVTMAPAAPARAEKAQRGSSVRTEVRRTPIAVVQEAVAADRGHRPPAWPPAPAGTTAIAEDQPLLRGEVVRPRHERAPPHHPYGSSSPRAPPSAPSS